VVALVAMAACNESKSPAPSTEPAKPVTPAVTTTTIAPPASAAVPAAKFTITFPQDGLKVPSEIIEVKGVGAMKGDVLEVSVLTNKWWTQNGQQTIFGDGTWSYGPCYLSGKGEFNKHTIRVTLIRNGVQYTSASVQGVVRDPE
jgi:hypothetical protein